ncbi:MAG: hypothetical protein KJZ74_01490 [Gemmatimonadales bacterium]|nr:hypothetical protein [Gemmatimonadota bacterium]MCL4212562.1 hypothetical protein [Gemmatimonadales bacterium]
MEIPLIVWISFWCEFLPLVAALTRPRALRGARAGVALWLVLLVVTNVAGLAWSQYLRLGNNHFISFAMTPLQGLAVLWAIAEWQVRPVLRMTVRLCIPLIALWWLVDIAFLEDITSFSTIGSPVYYLIALAAAMLALVTGAREEEESLLRQDWFWILSGLAIYFASNATVTIVQGAAIAGGDLALAVRAGTLKAVLDIISLLLMTGGFLWAPRLTSSGDSSLPGRSPSSSSSSPSWSPS